MTAIVAFLAMVAAVTVFTLILGRPAGGRLWLSHFVPAFAGCLMAIGPWTIARRYRLIRWYAAAALLPLGGLLLPILGLAYGYDAIALESAVVGGLSLLYGAGLFVAFLHRNPILEEAYDSES